MAHDLYTCNLAARYFRVYHQVLLMPSGRTLPSSIVCVLRLTFFSERDRNAGAQNVVSTPILDTSSYSAVKLVRGWMQECLSKHEECSISNEVLLPSRLLDVSNHRVKLVSTEGQEGFYLALSHCWGPKPIVMTLRANIEDRMVDIPWLSLSKTFQDAIILTWKLGYRYIWIDSLVSILLIQKDHLSLVILIKMLV